MFLFYSILGWIIECVDCSIERKKFVHDRGFLIGTYCPIYGFGAMYMYLFLTRYYNEPITLFVMAVVGTSIIEYVTGYLMEKIFNARWWDYSDMRFNLEGRVCLRNSLLFGLLGVLFVYVLNPIYMHIVRMIPSNVVVVLGIVLFCLFLVDCILSFSIVSKLKKNLLNLRKDVTSDIDSEVRQILSGYYFYFRKLFRSFPRVKFTFQAGERIVQSIHNTLDNFDTLRKERRKKLKELRKQLRLSRNKK